jgi:hypothetical protein
MKRFLGIIALLLLAGSVHAAESVWKSSNTATAESSAVLCGQGKRGHLFSVAVSSAGAAQSGITVYNSSFTTTTDFVGPIDTRAQVQYGYRTPMVKGMMYTKTGTAQVQILYDCY